MDERLVEVPRPITVWDEKRWEVWDGETLLGILDYSVNPGGGTQSIPGARGPKFVWEVQRAGSLDWEDFPTRKAAIAYLKAAHDGR